MNRNSGSSFAKTFDAQWNVSGATPLPDGKYSITLGTTANFEGYKTLVKGYADKGTFAVKEGFVTIKDGKIFSGKVTFDMRSIAVISTGIGGGNEMLAKHLKSKDFFDVDQFPTGELTFDGSTPDVDVSKTFRSLVSADLTLKGLKQEIQFPVRLYMKDGQPHADGALELDRTRWDIRYGSDKFFDNLADDVISDIFVVYFEITAKKS
ncbi:MAG: YceI family protein [Patescibacteria group bacterium]